MKAKFNKAIVILIITLCCATIVKAQDLIIKNDKSELKSKVVEITETSIKYKKWENIDGPIYNVSKNDVFMIVYANGKRDMIKQPDKQGVKQNQQNLNSPNTGLAATIQQNNTPAKSIDTAIDYKNIKVKYKPTRLYTGLQSPFSLGSDQEFRIIKNFVNLGLGYQYNFPKSDYVLESQSGMLYASFYAPINRLSGNFKKQDTGMFLFGNIAYEATSIKIYDVYAGTQTISSGGLTWRLGVDYMFSDFGLTFFTKEFNSFYAGIMVSF